MKAIKVVVSNSVNVLIIAFLCSHLPLLSQIDREKEVHETYQVNDNTKLTIRNKYGNVDIRDWDKKEIDIKVKIILEDVRESKAEELLNSIYIDFSQEGNEIIVETRFNDSFNKYFNGGNRDNNFEINYLVNMPKNVPLTISNKYGSVFINELTSICQVEVKYGKLKANKLVSASKEPMTTVNLGYSEATIEECKWLKMNIKYSKVKIIESKALIVLSKYSKVYLDKGSSLVTESKYDTYQVGTISNFVTTSGYTNFKFEEIKNKMQFETKYSDVKIELVPAGFKSIKIENQYGNYQIGIANDASYEIKGHAKYAKIHIPDNNRVSRFQESGELKIDGVVGTPDDELPWVKIETKYGGVDLDY